MNRIFPHRLAWWLTLVLCVGCAAIPTIPATPEIPATPAIPTSANAGETTIVAVQPAQAECCKQTLPEFLGITGLLEHFGGPLQGLLGGLRARLGTVYPGLEAGPPLLQLTDPANLESPVPSVKMAAEVKKEEDAAPQKAKAIAYLAMVGCGDCYPDVEDAILAALDDCSEIVRLAAVKGLREAAGSPCKACRAGSCCSAKVIERLDKIANEKDESNCYKEPSAKVRRYARMAMSQCGGTAIAEPIPEEGPTTEAPAEDSDITAQAPAAAVAARPLTEPTLATRGRSGRPSADHDTATAQPPSALPAAAFAPSFQGFVLARVDGEPIYEREVLAIVSEKLASEQTQISSEPVVNVRERLMRHELDRAIVRKLLCQEALRRQGDPHVLPASHDGSSADTSQSGWQGAEAVNAINVTSEEAQAAEWLRSQVRIDMSIPNDEMIVYHRKYFASHPFSVVRNRIRDEILGQRRARGEHAYVHQLRQRAQIWSIFDGITQHDFPRSSSAQADSWHRRATQKIE